MTEKQKKITLWLIIIILAGFLFYFWGNSVKNRIKSFKIEEFKESLNLPEIEMPKFEIPYAE